MGKGGHGKGASVKRSNRRRHTPIPHLAEHIAWYNAKREIKNELADLRARIATSLYRMSFPRSRERK
jgi:hypothetical protein